MTSSVPVSESKAPVNYAYPQGRTRETLMYTVVYTVAFLVLTVLGLSDGFNSESFGSWTWLSLITRGNREVLLTAAAAGLGSSLATILAFIEHAIYKRDFKNSFVPWYLLRPLMGAVLGVIFYFLIKGGLLALTSFPGQQGVSDLDQYALAGMATLVGFFSRQAIDKLKDVFDAMFSTSNEKVRSSEAKAKNALLAVRDATYRLLLAETPAGGDPDQRKTLEAVWQRVSGQDWTIGEGDEAALKTRLKEKLKGMMTDVEAAILGY